jgi:hypothetical protein
MHTGSFIGLGEVVPGTYSLFIGIKIRIEVEEQ